MLMFGETSKTTILVQVQYQNPNPNWPILSADTVRDQIIKSFKQVVMINILNFKFSICHLTEVKIGGKCNIGFCRKSYGSDTNTKIQPWFDSQYLYRISVAHYFDPPKTALHNRTDTNYSPAIMNIDKFGDDIFLHCP